MSWSIEQSHNVALVTMTSNKVNAQNPEFYQDLQEAFDRLETGYADCAVVLTGTGASFSAGLDFEYVLPLFAKRDWGEIRRWFEEYREILLRVFTYPKPTVAAMNGHAYAGGLIIGLCCDFRIGASGEARFSLNEVPIGVPMPSVCAEIIRYALGAPAGALVTLLGQVYDVQGAQKLGILHEAVPPAELRPAAFRWAQRVHPDCFEAYAFSKRALQQPYLATIESYAKTADAEILPRKMSHALSVRAQTRRYSELKGKPPAWIK